jgi:hypothetical protein
MKPKEKAEELVKLYAKLIWDEKEFKMELYKQCALIAVNELISSHNKWDDYAQTNSEEYYYWQEIKKELELL